MHHWNCPHCGYRNENLERVSCNGCGRAKELDMPLTDEEKDKFDYDYCPRCGHDVEFHDSGHERDSSNDYYFCPSCRWHFYDW